MSNNETKKEPLFHIVKKESLSLSYSILVRAIAIIAALVVSGLFIVIASGQNPFKVYKIMFEGAFGTSRRVWNLLHNTFLLLGISLAVTPAFKMKFWNCGAEGQALIGGLATYAVMRSLGGIIPSWLLVIVMVLASVFAGAIWALIPAIFKAKWNTNETLFTLMMNYIAMYLVSFFQNKWVLNGTTTLPRLSNFGLPKIVNDYILNIIIIAIITGLLYVYLNYHKHGYEISVVGESQNTAKYIGIDVKKVIIRTLIISGAICGLVGLIYVGGKDYTIRTDTLGGNGFTAIMVSWLAKFNPIIMILTSFLIAFLNGGASNLSTVLRMDDAIAKIIIGTIILFIIGCEFFTNYQIVFKKKKSASKAKVKEENK